MRVRELSLHNRYVSSAFNTQIKIYSSTTPRHHFRQDATVTIVSKSKKSTMPNDPTNDVPLAHYSMFGNLGSTLASSLKWCPTSMGELAQAEAELLSDIGPGWGRPDNKIRTIELDPELQDGESSVTRRQPLVMIHGFAAGVGTWILNLDPLLSKLGRKIYAFDIIGFGRSTRAPFDLNGDVEGQFVESIERWRQAQGIEKFIILGHSFGGYLSASYALRHPERVSHVILADPWGVSDRRSSSNQKYKFPLWVRMANSIFQSFNPLAILRVSGPYGPSLVQKFRGDLREKFRPVLDDDCHKFLTYIYHCNAQTAAGESAFKALALPFGWPKNPLIHRLLNLDQRVSMTFIYGSRSWIEKKPGELIQEWLTPARVAVHVIQGSGHHVYADKYAEFNNLVLEACNKVEG